MDFFIPRFRERCPRATARCSGLQTQFFTREGGLDNLTFQVGKGEIVGLVGESGSGKSVTGFSIVRLLKHPGKDRRRRDPLRRQGSDQTLRRSDAGTPRPRNFDGLPESAIVSEPCHLGRRADHPGPALPSRNVKSLGSTRAKRFVCSAPSTFRNRSAG